jgi:hypothetical protein
MSGLGLGRRALIALAFTAALLAALPVVALADGSRPGTTGFVIGPLHAKDGVTVTIYGSGRCSGRTGYLSVDYSKGGARASISHSYLDSKAKASCSVARNLRGGRLQVRWGSLLRISVRFTHAGAARKPTRIPDCRQFGGLDRFAQASGTMLLDIHAKQFGRIRVRSAHVLLTRSPRLKCHPPEASSREIDLIVDFGQGPSISASSLSLFANQPPRGQRMLDITGFADHPGQGITGTVGAFFEGGASLFSAASNLSSAHVGADRPLLTGQLKFTALPACPGSPDAVNGTLSGRLVLHDPVLGKLSIPTGTLQAASLIRGNGSPPSCNGPGSQLAKASFGDDCNAPGICSVSGQTNTVDFYDTSNPGTQQITSESWSFGDGSPPLAGTPGGQVSHTYTSPGTYTVTLTITTTSGQTSTATNTVYIGS